MNSINKWLNRVLVFAGCVFLSAMVLLTCANIVLRRFGRPIEGTYELMALFGAVVTASALGFTQNMKDNIAVDILFNNFSEKLRTLLRIVNATICVLFFCLAGWQLCLIGIRLHKTGEVTETLRIAFYPFTFFVAAGFFVLAVSFLADIITALPSRSREEKK